MNILHLLSQTHLTGAEVYATQLITQQQTQHNCFIVSDTLNTATTAKFTPQNIDKRDVINRMKNLWFLSKFCKKHNINIIHSHSRASSWLAYCVGNYLNIKTISTVHGRQIAKRKNIYGDNIIVICDALKEHLIKDLNIPDSAINVIHNGFALLPMTQNNVTNNKVAWVGRLTGAKGEVIKKLANNVFKYFPNIQVTCFGGPNDKVAEFNNSSPNNVRFVGQVESVVTKLNNYSIVFGSGRVAIEALFLGKPVYAIGEVEAVGFINNNNFQQASFSNFGDCGELENINLDKVKNELTQFIKTPQTYGLSEQLKTYQITNVYQKIMQVYEN